MGDRISSPPQGSRVRCGQWVDGRPAEPRQELADRIRPEARSWRL